MQMLINPLPSATTKHEQGILIHTDKLMTMTGERTCSLMSSDNGPVINLRCGGHDYEQHMSRYYASKGKEMKRL